MRLSQVIALDKNTKNQANVRITAAYHEIQKAALFAGIAKTYESKNEDGEHFPDERQNVQRRAEELLNFTAKEMIPYWDLTLTKDTANCEATSDVVVDGQTIYKRSSLSICRRWYASCRRSTRARAGNTTTRRTAT
jgi:hypothetical protein